MKGKGTLIHRQKALLKREYEETHAFIQQLKSEGPIRPLATVTQRSSGMIQPSRTGGGKASIDREIERYWHPHPR